MRTRFTRGAIVAVAAGVALLLTACGSAPGSSGAGGTTVPVDVGTGTPVNVKTGPLKVGIFMNAVSNQWQKSLAETATKTAESFGWKATVVDFNFDQQRMTDSLLSAATNHTYDAIAIVPIDGQQSCKMLTETMPKNNILVTVAGPTLCGRDLNTGDDIWAPGTLSFNQIAPSYDYAKIFLQKTTELFPGPQKVAMVVGPPQQGNTIIMHKLAEEQAPTNPEFAIKDFLTTDYTTPTTFAAVQNYLQANPDTTVLMSVYSPDISRGVVQALESLNLVGKVNVTDMGGSQYTVDQIKSGTIQLTMPYYPENSGRNMVQSIKDAQDGKPPVRVNDEIPGGINNPPVITSQNVASFNPQF